jgi:hypothetical protein
MEDLLDLLFRVCKIQQSYLRLGSAFVLLLDLMDLKIKMMGALPSKNM